MEKGRKEFGGRKNLDCSLYLLEGAGPARNHSSQVPPAPSKPKPLGLESSGCLVPVSVWRDMAPQDKAGFSPQGVPGGHVG